MPGMCQKTYGMRSLYETWKVSQDCPLAPSKPLVICIHLKILLALDHAQIRHERGEGVVSHLRGRPAGQSILGLWDARLLIRYDV